MRYIPVLGVSAPAPPRLEAFKLDMEEMWADWLDDRKVRSRAVAVPWSVTVKTKRFGASGSFVEKVQ